MKELLRITVYEDIGEPHKITFEGKTTTTRDSIELRMTIDSVLGYRLRKNHDKLMQEMKEKGAIKHK